MTPPVEGVVGGVANTADTEDAADTPDTPEAANGAVGVLEASAPDLLRAAAPGDVDAMATLINRYAALGLMLPKAPADLYRLFREFVVVEGAGGELLGCGGLRVYDRRLAEIVGLAVDERWQGRGTGRRIVERLVEEAVALGMDRVFAMTLQEPFFHRLGFETTSLSWIPEKIAADCRSCARRAGCGEIAVIRRLRGGPEDDRGGPGAVEPCGIRGMRVRRLRVLPSNC